MEYNGIKYYVEVVLIKFLSQKKEMKWIFKYIKQFKFGLALLALGSTMVSAAGVFNAVASKKLIDAVSTNKPDNLFFVSLTFGFLFILQIVLQYFMSLYETKINMKLKNQMRKNTLKYLAGVKWIPYTGLHSAQTISCLTSDVSSASSLVSKTIPLIFSMMSRLTISFIVLFGYNNMLALVILCAAFLIVVTGRIFSPGIKKRHLECRKAESLLMKKIQEMLKNMLIVKTFDLEGDCVHEIEKLQDDHYNKTMSKQKFGSGASFLMSAGFGAGYFLTFLWGVFGISKGSITFGMFTAFLQLTAQIQGPLAGIAGTLPNISSSLASAARIMELESLPEEEKTEVVLPKGRWGIEFRNVTFGYTKNKPVLKDFNLTIYPGQIIGIGGLSGRGKTTLLNLMLALLEPSKGDICLFNEREERIPVSCGTRNFFSYVPQGNFMFSGSFPENLQSASKNLSYHEMNNSLEIACAENFVSNLIKSGENGEGYSTGQLQRISVARALLKESPIMLMDEPASALDNLTEKKMFDKLFNKSSTRTYIVVSHRDSFKKYCDKFIMLDDVS